MARVFCNTAVSLDGKIGVADKRKLSIGSREDWRRMSVIRRLADAIIVGGATFRAFPEGYVEHPDRIDAPSERPRPIWNVVVTRNFDLPLDAPAFGDPRLKMLLIGPHDAPASAVKRFEGKAQIDLLEQVTPETIISAVEKRGASELLLEAGGGLTGQFLAAKRVDELYLTLVPRILAGEKAPSLAEGDLFSYEEAPRLALESVEQVSDELFLRYRVLR